MGACRVLRSFPRFHVIYRRYVSVLCFSTWQGWWWAFWSLAKLDARQFDHRLRSPWRMCTQTSEQEVAARTTGAACFLLPQVVEGVTTNWPYLPLTLPVLLYSQLVPTEKTNATAWPLVYVRRYIRKIVSRWTRHVRICLKTIVNNSSILLSYIQAAWTYAYNICDLNETKRWTNCITVNNTIALCNCSLRCAAI